MRFVTILLFPLMIVLCSCVSNQPVRIDDSNVFEHIKVDRGSSVYGNSFFKSATNKHLGKCLTDYSVCTKKQLTLGEQIEAQIYDIYFMGTRVWVNQPKDKLFAAAAMITAQEGFKYFTPVMEFSSYRYSETPKASVDCTAVFNTAYCSTDSWTETTYWQQYNLSFIAYNNYEDIKNGVLAADGHPYHPLYSTKEKNSIFNVDEIESNARRTMRYYDDAWKTKYDALEILKGEQLENRPFTFNDKQLSPSYVSMQEKYKQ